MSALERGEPAADAVSPRCSSMDGMSGEYIIMMLVKPPPLPLTSDVAEGPATGRRPK